MDEGLRLSLEKLGGARLESGDVSRPEPLVVVPLTGGTERSVLDILRRRAESAGATPALLLAVHGANSLPSALEALARLRQDGGRGRVVYVDGPADEVGLSSLDDAVSDLEARTSLRHARIGLVGSPSGWLVASSPDPEVVRTRWGPFVVPISLERMLEAVRNSPESAGGELASALTSGAHETREPSGEEVRLASRVSDALQSLIAEFKLTAVTLRCFDLIDEVGTTGCVALSETADRGIPAGCEGDLVSTVGLVWVGELLGLTGWMANPASVDVSDGSIVLAHCTVPRTILSRYALRSHFESGTGVAISGDLTEGAVTLLRIGGREMDMLWVVEGSATSSGGDETLCRTQVHVRLNDASRLEELLEEPLGNHLILVAGHHADRLRSWWRAMVADRS